jgi:hypothetical protein
VVLTSFAARADYWTLSSRNAVYDSVTVWNNGTCEAVNAYREGRESSGVWWWTYGIISPWQNTQNWTYAAGFQFPNSYQVLLPESMPSKNVEAEDATHSIVLHGERTFALWDGDNGFLNQDLDA